MRTYQTLTLIGAILGMLIIFGAYATTGLLNVTVNILENMSRQESDSASSIKRQADMQYVSAAAGVTIVLYIAALVLAFAIKQRTKIVGISLILIAIITVIATSLFGVIGFALLLPAGIVALKYKHDVTKPSSVSP
jgi:hypothetical protein